MSRLRDISRSQTVGPLRRSPAGAGSRRLFLSVVAAHVDDQVSSPAGGVVADGVGCEEEDVAPLPRIERLAVTAQAVAQQEARAVPINRNDSGFLFPILYAFTD